MAYQGSDRQFVVLRREESALRYSLAMGVDDYEDGREWLCKYGDIGEKYQIATFEGPLLQVTIEQVERRVLVDVSTKGGVGSDGDQTQPDP